jgi:hypothetical protein
MHATPTVQLLNFFQAAQHADAPAIATWEDARDRANELLEEASTKLVDAGQCFSDIPAKLQVADEVVALCTGAVAAAHGLLLGAPAELFKHDQALAALSAELELSETTSGPMQEVRARVSGAVSITEADAFLAHQGMHISGGLIEWTADRVSAVLTH